jgi:hypothetical protein
MIEHLYHEKADLFAKICMNALPEQTKFINKIRYSYENNATVIEGTRREYLDGTIHFIKEQEYCSICNIPGHTHCDERANCMTISLAEEHRANIKSKQIDFSRIVYKVKQFGIIATGVRINNTDFWHFRKGDCIDGKIMPDGGVKIVKPSGSIQYRYNNDKLNVS